MAEIECTLISEIDRTREICPSYKDQERYCYTDDDDEASMFFRDMKWKGSFINSATVCGKNSDKNETHRF